MSLEQEKDPLLAPEVKAAENGKGGGGARELEPDVVSCAHPTWAHQGGGGGIPGSALPPDAVWGGPGMAGFPQAQLSPPPTAAQDLPATQLGQARPKKGHTTPSGPTGVWRNGSPSSGKRWSAKSRNRNYTKGKTGRVHEVKTARKGFAFNAHIVLPSLSWETILSSGAQCQMFAWSVHGGLQSPQNPRQS